jgi:prepilin-type N-terminal cleavage/methylation domain-containing protein
MRKRVITPSRSALVQSSERGFGMPELLISMFLLAVIMAGSFRALDDAMKASDVGGMIADGTQNLRMAVTLMTRDILQTGREVPNAGIPLPDGTSLLAFVRPGPPGSALTYPTAWTSMPAVCPGNGLGPTINGVATDIVTVLFADAALDLNQYPLVSISTDGSQITVNSATVLNDARTGLKAGDLIWFTNAVGDTIQTVTSVVGQNVFFVEGDAADTFKFNQRTSATGGSLLQMKSSGTYPSTSATRVTMVSYYIDNVTAPGQFRLMRREGNQAARMVANGIENLQATYDIVDEDTNPVNQADTDAPTEIRKINLFMGRRSVRSLLQTGRPVRSSVATQVSLRSMSFVDRYE